MKMNIKGWLISARQVGARMNFPFIKTLASLNNPLNYKGVIFFCLRSIK